MIVLPCSSQYKAYDGTVRGGGDECEWDLKAHYDYLGRALNILFLYNHGSFDQKEYGSDRISKTSTLHLQNTDSTLPSWTEVSIHSYSLVDETSLIRIATQTEDEFTKIDFGTSVASVLSTWPTKDNP